jgi:hypothetical protein
MMDFDFKSLQDSSKFLLLPRNTSHDAVLFEADATAVSASYFHRFLVVQIDLILMGLLESWNSIQFHTRTGGFMARCHSATALLDSRALRILPRTQCRTRRRHSKRMHFMLVNLTAIENNSIMQFFPNPCEQFETYAFHAREFDRHREQLIIKLLSQSM